MNSSNPPHISWDWGTAYDLFASLMVLLQPDEFGLRASWAAGVRSRLPAQDRHFLEEVAEFVYVPYRWIYSLPAPKDAATALGAFGQIPPVERLRTLVIHPDIPPEVEQMLTSVTQRNAWGEKDLEVLRTLYHKKAAKPSPKLLATLLDWCARPEDFGECYLEALRAYYLAFFAEEERRIRPVLQEAVQHAQALAEEMPLPQLLEQLSQGVQLSPLLDTPELVLVPSYWITPLVMWGHIAPDRMILLFGGRPADAALVPGEQVPDALLHALKALADPTRLRVIRYLTGEPLTIAQLSRRLRLRAPTLVHHLNALRLAGLVHVELNAEGEKRYAVRTGGIQSAFDALQKFLAVEE